MSHTTKVERNVTGHSYRKGDFAHVQSDDICKIISSLLYLQPLLESETIPDLLQTVDPEAKSRVGKDLGNRRSTR